MSDTVTIQRFEVRNRFTGRVQFTAEIECAPDAPVSVRLGLAVRWAVKAGANLSGASLARANLAGANLSGANLSGASLARANLAGANLSGANLSGASLARANLAGANLSGANLAGADLAGARIKSIVAIITRITGGFTFHGYDTDQGLRIVAGCRNFSPDEYRAHVAREYPDTPKAAETLAIISYIEARHAALTDARSLTAVEAADVARGEK